MWSVMLDMVTGQILQFTAAGSPKQLSQAIETYAQENAMVHALVVPWESEPDSLSMAVTSVKKDGWAIEHTNLGTIKLTDLGNELTRVAVIAHNPDDPDKEKLADRLGGFAREIQSKFQAS
jgi:hypothetical protein